MNYSCRFVFFKILGIFVLSSPTTFAAEVVSKVDNTIRKEVIKLTTGVFPPVTVRYPKYSSVAAQLRTNDEKLIKAEMKKRSTIQNPSYPFTVTVNRTDYSKDLTGKNLCTRWKSFSIQLSAPGGNTTAKRDVPVTPASCNFNTSLNFEGSIPSSVSALFKSAPGGLFDFCYGNGIRETSTNYNMGDINVAVVNVAMESSLNPLSRATPPTLKQSAFLGCQPE